MRRYLSTARACGTAMRTHPNTSRAWVASCLFRCLGVNVRSYLFGVDGQMPENRVPRRTFMWISLERLRDVRADRWGCQ